MSSRSTIKKGEHNLCMLHDLSGVSITNLIFVHMSLLSEPAKSLSPP